MTLVIALHLRYGQEQEQVINLPATLQFLQRHCLHHPMDFLERLFGFSPDGGSGAFEFLLFLIPIVGIVGLQWRRRRRKRPIDRDDEG